MSLNMMSNIEKGLQSANFADHMSAIAQCAKAIRDNPFPTSVNTILLRLVDIFQGDKQKMEQSLNLIRLRIVKLLKECNLDLSSAQDEPIVRCIMKVSHSNDYKARSLAMLFLAAVSPVVHANKKVHYLLLEALDCEDLTELTSTTIAVGAVGRFSSDFSAIVVDKIGKMLLKEEIDTSIKVRLMEDLSSFQQKLEVTRYCVDLGKRLLQSNPEHRMCVAIICALTEMAKRNGLGLSEHITLILDEMGKVKDNEILLNCCLTNLLELAHLPHHWDANQVSRLFNYQGNVCRYESTKPLILWLQALNYLIQHTHASALPTNDLFGRALPLAQINNYTVQIYLFEMLYSRLEYDLDSEKGILLNNLLNEISVELSKKDSAVCLGDRIKFYKMVVSFIKTKRVKGITIDALTFSEYLMAIDNSYPEQVFLKSLDTLNVLCETIPDVGRSVCSRAINILRKNYGTAGKYLDAPTELYSLAFQPFPTYSAHITKIVEAIQQELTESKRWWFGFKLARMGLRYGHWSNVALPLLEQIQGNCDTIEVSSFIMTLIYVAKAQLSPNFNISTLNRASHNLRHASLLLKPLVQTSRNSQSFIFAASYIDCLYELFGAFSAVLISLNSNKNFEVGPRTIHHMEYTRLSMDKARTNFTETRKKWIALQERSFDADEHTQQQLELFVRYCQLLESILTRIVASDFNEMAPIALHATSATNCQLEQLIDWGINQTNESIHAVTGSSLQRANVWKNNFDRLSEMFTYLSQIPLCLPRSFFQQIYQTKIKLNVTPQPKEREQALTLNSRQLALSVEGFIETTNPKRIQKIIVYVHVNYADKENDPPVIDSRACEVCDNYFFKVNLLLNVAKSAEISTSLAFMDSIEKRTWKMGTLNQFQVIAPESH